MIRIASLFLWLIVPLGLWLAVALWGTPHVLGTYQYLGTGYLPPEERRHTTCNYYGWQGVITTPAEHNRCRWVRFFKAGF